MKPRVVPVYSPAFDAFWALWPRKVAKLAAWKEWQAWKLDNDPAVLPALRLQLPAFCKRDPEHVPHASTWLHQRRWEDEIAPQSANGAATRAPVESPRCEKHKNRDIPHTWMGGRRAADGRPCVDCKHVAAQRRERSVGEDELFREGPGFEDLKPMSREQLAEMARDRKALRRNET
ncbi:MAG: hypothetical protein RLZZ393_215 [Pseudomonadota bacterium]